MRNVRALGNAGAAAAIVSAGPSTRSASAAWAVGLLLVMHESHVLRAMRRRAAGAIVIL